MQKSYRKTVIILAIVVAVLLAATLTLYFVLRDEKEETPTTEDTSITLWQQELTTIQSFSYTYFGQTLAFAPQNGTWRLTGEADFPLNTALLQNPSGNCMLAKCMEFIYARKVLDNCDNLARYGLDNPSLTLQITFTDRTEAFTFGTTYGTDYRYCMRAGDSALYLVDKSYYTVFAYTKTELIPGPTPFEGAEAALSSATWQTSQGNASVTDAQVLRTLARQLKEVGFTQMIDYHAAANYRRYGLDTEARACLTFSYYNSEEDKTANENQEAYVLYFGKTEDGKTYFYEQNYPSLVYAMSEATYLELISHFA